MYELHRPGLTQAFKAASLIAPHSPVTLGGTTEPLLIPVGTENVEVFGISQGATVRAGEFCTVYERQNVVKVKAGASLGAGADVGVASWGLFGPHTAASGTTKWIVGKAQTDAAAGEYFACYINQRKNGNVV